MILASEFAAADLISVGPRLVGVTFIWTALIKAVAPEGLARHLWRVGWVPDKLVYPGVTAIAAFEAGLGVALILLLAPGILLPFTVVLLVVLSAISWWSVRSGRASDCGCYGGMIQPSIGQSIALNALFAALVMLPWLAGERAMTARGRELAVTVGVAIAAGIFTEITRRWPITHDKPLFDLNPLKVGKQWRHRWAGGATARLNGEFLVAYLGPHCPYCVEFVSIANAMVQSPALPRVIGVVAVSRQSLDAFVQERNIRFPVVTVSESLMGRLAEAVPTIAVVKDGIISEQWSGGMPPEFARRFTRAFFPSAAKLSAPGAMQQQA